MINSIFFKIKNSSTSQNQLLDKLKEIIEPLVGKFTFEIRDSEGEHKQISINPNLKLANIKLKGNAKYLIDQIYYLVKNFEIIRNILLKWKIIYEDKIEYVFVAYNPEENKQYSKIINSFDTYKHQTIRERVFAASIDETDNPMRYHKKNHIYIPIIYRMKGSEQIIRKQLSINYYHEDNNKNVLLIILGDRYQTIDSFYCSIHSIEKEDIKKIVTKKLLERGFELIKLEF